MSTPSTKRPPSPTAPSSDKKLRPTNSLQVPAASTTDKASIIATDEFEEEKKVNVPGSVGLGGGEAEGLVLSHAVSFWCWIFLCTCALGLQKRHERNLDEIAGGSIASLGKRLHILVI